MWRAKFRPYRPLLRIMTEKPAIAADIYHCGEPENCRISAIAAMAPQFDNTECDLCLLNKVLIWLICLYVHLFSIHVYMRLEPSRVLMCVYPLLLFVQQKYQQLHLSDLSFFVFLTFDGS